MANSERGQKGRMTFKQEVFKNYSDLVEDAKKTAVALMGDKQPDALDLFYTENLEEIENGIKKLNEFSSKCWLISAITLYAMIYDKQLYQQSGLSWEDYLHVSRERLGLDPRDISEQLSSARFFIKYHAQLQKAGWSPIGSNRKLARAELALELSNNLKETIAHVANDTWKAFNEWYSSFKLPPAITPPSQHEIPKTDVSYKKGTLSIGGKIAVSISNDIDASDRVKLESYLKKIADALLQGYEPAIIPVYDTNEANVLVHLRDKNRQNK